MVYRVFVLALALPLLALIGQSPAQATDRDCGDFATQAAAQAFFLSAGPGDPHRLDSDGDRVVCESNPCPCSTGQAPQPFAGTSPTSSPSPTPTTTPGSTDPEGSGSSGPVRRDVGNVVKVTDGDTLKVRIDGVGIRDIRLLGIDTPEKYGRRECGGELATAAMGQEAPVGSRVVLRSDPSQAAVDRYGRLLRYVMRNGRDVGRRQIITGHAQVYVYRNDPFGRTAWYRRAERAAKVHGRGLWNRCW